MSRPALPGVLYLYAHRDACAYWRIFAPAAALVAKGYPIRVFNAFDDRAQAAARGAQVLVLTRIGWPPEDWLAGIRWLARRREEGLTLVYETDDDVFSEAFLAQARVVLPDRPVALLNSDRLQRTKVLQQCDGVLVTTPRLATLVRTYTDRPVVIVPNAIDWDRWRTTWAQARPPFPDVADRVVIGWAGGKRDDGDLAPMAAAWAAIAAQCPQTRFVVAGYAAPLLLAAVPADRLVVAPWLPIDYYPCAYRGWDIACAPLEDKAFNYYKSPIKIFEAAAAEAAVVASPTVYSVVLRHRRDGLIASTADEWEAALWSLVTDASLRRRYVATWGRRVQREYSLAANLSRWPAAWAYLRAQPRAAVG